MKKTNVIQEIKAFSSGDQESERALVEIIISQTSLQLLQITTCLKSNNWDQLKNIAHKLYSTFIFLKIPRAKELTEAIRTTAGTNIEATQKEAIELIEICNDFIFELKNYSTLNY